MKVFIITFGCKVNQYESQIILEDFIKEGFLKASSELDADIVIVNSCTVTAESDKKVKKTLRRIRKGNRESVIVLTGCMPQAFPGRDFSNADIVLGNSNKSEILQKVMTFLVNKHEIIDITPYESKCNFDPFKIESFNERMRAFIKIEDGCNRFCSYCIIPYARGRVRSKPIKDLFDEVQNLAYNGYNEIVLVGINLSAYGQDIGLNLCDAVEAVCNIPKVKRVRLGSLEPDHMGENIIKRLSKQTKLCPQFHLSLQSGCDETLKRMNRHYTSEEYFKVVSDIRKNFNNASITTDVMVGFPGEAELEFIKSLEFVQKVGFAKVHVFPYSIRPGTRAATFENQVAPLEKEKRVHKMIEVTNKSRQEFLNLQVKNVEEVLFEKSIDDGFFEGYTKNYVPVIVRSNENLNSKILKVKINTAKDNHCIGEIV
ncbi:MAG: Threonylcarbamoyladenosine tRNA methylthiotransferase MtaB [Eubacteriales bacterium SKADARSKE-1]|nr:Threonylcarbamoyladenosine tRNA methylthiotransferase MtaB [Eubacteriales bacterium SKADARSKE-1]